MVNRSQYISSMWKTMSNEEKEPYVRRSDASKKEYAEQKTEVKKKHLYYIFK